MLVLRSSTEASGSLLVVSSILDINNLQVVPSKHHDVSTDLDWLLDSPWSAGRSFADCWDNMETPSAEHGTSETHPGNARLHACIPSLFISY